MMTPATARTGTSVFMPISGASAAARITPVPKPPRPPITAAPRPSAATAARVGASSSNLARYRARPRVVVDGDVGERRLGHFHDLRIRRPALGVDLDRDADRGAADPDEIGIEGKHVADLHRLLEDELLHGDRGHAAARDAAGDDAAGDVDLRTDHAPEHGAVLLCGCR